MTDNFTTPAEATTTPRPPRPPRKANTLATIALVFSFVAFVPPLNLVALVLGAVAAGRGSRFSMRAAIACFAGGFFTVTYTLVLCGFLMTGMSPTSSQPPGYGFLAVANPALSNAVASMTAGDWLNAGKRLDSARTSTTGSNWTFECAAAVVRYRLFDNTGALRQFKAAAAMKPDVAEFHYHYGKALLRDSSIPLAIGEFAAALEIDPGLAAAARHLELAGNAYIQSPVTMAIGYVIILLLLFTVHEFAHAYAAFKLGDHTAAEAGRLSLNPLRHLDPFGSILIPAFMIWQQAGIVFGWARPVPVNPGNFAEPRRDSMVVAFAGPATNLVIAAVCFLLMVAIGLAIRIAAPDAMILNVAYPFSPVAVSGIKGAEMLAIHFVFLKQVFYTTLVLGFFNLMPIPPLDGAGLLSGLFPGRYDALVAKMQPYAMILFLLLILVFYVLLIFPFGLAGGLLYLSFLAMGYG
ncbi:MAG: site-2 protease family protein [bacterium]